MKTKQPLNSPSEFLMGQTRGKNTGNDSEGLAPDWLLDDMR